MQLRLRIILLLIGGLLIGINQLFPINFNNQVNLLLVVLFVLGIPHGALDFFIDKKIQNNQQSLDHFDISYDKLVEKLLKHN